MGGLPPQQPGSVIARMVLRKYDDDLEDSLRLWRYMSLDRFVHLLATETLWLAPLSTMEDKREGTWIDVQASKFQDQVQQGYDHAAAQTVVSSWIAANEELLHMWNSYASEDAGIAISTDVHSLLRTLAGSSMRDDAFYLMKVEYCDQPRTIPVAIPGVYRPVLCAKYKSSDFRHEHEVRVVYSRSMLSTLLTPGVPPTSGTYINIKSIGASMKNGVFVSPRANPWMIETVKSVMRTYGHDPSLVRQSALTHLFETPTAPPFEHNISYE